MARESSPDPAMLTGLTPAGMDTTTGVDVAVVELLPSWPYSLSPQLYSFPLLPMAMLWYSPAATAVAVTPAGSDTSTRVDAFVVAPSPNWPKPP